jgi:hypothetical protein
MATTTNYSWSTPDDTALVKDGAAAIRSLGTAIDTTVFNNAGAAIAKTIVDAKGDIIAATAADTLSRLAVGANDTVLTADSTAATGLKWAAAGASSGPTFKAFRNTSVQSVAQNTYTKVQFNAESWDTDSCFDSTTNYRFTPNKSGYYSLISRLGINQSTNNLVSIELYKNGTAVDVLQYGSPTNSTDYVKGNSAIAYANGTTDYFEIYVYLGAGTTREIDVGAAWSIFTGVWIRS